MKAVARGAELLLLPDPKDDKQWGRGVDMLRDLAEGTITQRRILAPRIKIPLHQSPKGTNVIIRFGRLLIRLPRSRGFYTITTAKKFFNSVAE